MPETSENFGKLSDVVGFTKVAHRWPQRLLFLSIVLVGEKILEKIEVKWEKSANGKLLIIVMAAKHGYMVDL